MATKDLSRSFRQLRFGNRSFTAVETAFVGRCLDRHRQRVDLDELDDAALRTSVFHRKMSGASAVFTTAMRKRGRGACCWAHRHHQRYRDMSAHFRIIADADTGEATILRSVQLPPA